jgi:ABC-2 type transport system permease protein
MDNAYDSVQQNEARQDRFVLVSTVFSPFMAFRNFSMQIAATDMRVHQNFSENAEQHRRDIGVIVDSFYQKNTVAGNVFWKTIPQFAYEAPGVGWRLSGAVGSVVALLGWLVAAVGLMLFSYRKMTV